MTSVSVVMAVYGRSKYLPYQISSICAGYRLPEELILFIDKHPFENYSDRELNQMAKGLKIKICRSESNLGPAESFRRGIIQSSGEILCLCDQDDIWSKSKLKVVVKSHKDADATIHQGKVIRSNNLDDSQGLMYEGDPTKSSFFGQLVKNKIFGCTMSIRGDLGRSIARKTKFSPMHDWILILILKLSRANVKFISDPIFSYRRHNDNFTQLKSQNSLFLRIKFRLRLCLNLIRYVI